MTNPMLRWRSQSDIDVQHVMPVMEVEDDKDCQMYPDINRDASLAPGMLVRIKDAPNWVYAVVQTFTENGGNEGWEEEWAELRTSNGDSVFWRVCQLEEA